MRPQELQIALQKDIPSQFPNSATEDREAAAPSHYSVSAHRLEKGLSPASIWRKIQTIIQGAGGKVEEITSTIDRKPPQLEVYARVISETSVCRISIRSIISGDKPTEFTIAIITDPLSPKEDVPTLRVVASEQDIA